MYEYLCVIQSQLFLLVSLKMENNNAQNCLFRTCYRLLRGNEKGFAILGVFGVRGISVILVLALISFSIVSVVWSITVKKSCSSFIIDKLVIIVPQIIALLRTFDTPTWYADNVFSASSLMFWLISFQCSVSLEVQFASNRGFKSCNLLYVPCKSSSPLLYSWITRCIMLDGRDQVICQFPLRYGRWLHKMRNQSTSYPFWC